MDKNKLIDTISITLLIVFIILLRIYTVRPIVILNESKFLIISASIGLAFSICWIYILFKKKRDYFVKEKKRIGHIIFQILTIIIATIFIAGLHIYKSGKKNIFIEKATILNKGFYTKTGAGWFKVKIVEDIEKIDVKTSVYENFHIGDTVNLTIGKGGWGYSVLYEFN